MLNVLYLDPFTTLFLRPIFLSPTPPYTQLPPA